MLFLFASTVLIVASTAFISMRGQVQKTKPSKAEQAQAKIDFESRFPIADYSEPESSDAQERTKRKAKDNRFAKGVLDEMPDVTESKIVDGNGLESLPALPVALSDLIIVGNTLNARSYLSTNKTGLFSEFTIAVEEVMKNAGSDQVLAVTSILVEREGGRIRYPSGRIRWIRFAHEGMPLIGARYVLFLRRAKQGEANGILTAYELRAGKVFPLDGVAEFEENKLAKFAAYEGVEESTFLTTIRGMRN